MCVCMCVCVCVCVCVCIAVYDLAGVREIFMSIFHYHHHHHNHVVPLARISLALSPHLSLSVIASGRSSGLHPVSSHSCHMFVRAGRPALLGHMRGSIGVHHL